MKTAPHLLVCISAHGYGHVAQVAPILNLLRAKLPHLRISLRTIVSVSHLSNRIAGEFQYIEQASDFGMCMASAMEVKVEESFKAYADFHADWNVKVAQEAEALKLLAPDLVLSDVAYLPLAASARLGIPSIAMCSLNWADIFRHYCSAFPGAEAIHQQIKQAYAGADAFLRLTPGMPMSWLKNLLLMGPVAGIGMNRRQQINELLNLKNKEKLVLVSMGGISTRLPIDNWPQMPGIRWLVQNDWQVKRQDVSAIESLAMDFTDVLASCDAILSKSGYGAFAEAACNGIPMIYVERHDWPEQGDLVAWLQQDGRCLKLDMQQIQTGDFASELQKFLALSKPVPVAPSGIKQVTEFLLKRLA